jgi:tape measure domain-containing protein
MSNNNDMNVAIHFTTAGGQVVVKDVTSISQVSAQAAQQLEHVGTAGAKAKTGLDATAAGASDANQYTTLLKATLATLVGSFSALQLISVGDDWGQMAARIKQATETSGEYNYVQQRMIKSANDTFRSITETREGFISMSPILRDMNYSLSQSIDITDSFSALLVTNAVSADRAASAQDALAGSIQKGRVESDAWQTLFGVMPTILDNLTASTGKTGAEIRQLGIEGKLSITELTNALLQNQQANLAAVKEMPTTVRDALQSLGNFTSDYIGKQNEAYGVTALLAEGIVDVAEALMSITTEPLEELDPSLQATVKTVELLTYMLGVAGVAALAKYGYAQGGVIVGQLILNTQFAATRAALAGVTASAVTTTVAMNALNMAKNALFGPIGILIGVLGVAATAFYTYRDAAEEAKKKNDELQNSFANWSNQRKADAYNGAVNQLNELNSQIDATQAKIKASFRPGSEVFLSDGVSRSDVLNAEKELAELKAKKEELNRVIDQLNKNFNAGLPALDDYSDRLTNNSTSTTAFKDELLKLYNQQKLNAEAISATGAALTGIDLELFKAQFVEATNLPENAAAAIKAYAEQYKVAAATLNLDGYLKQMQQELGLLDVRLQKGEQEYEQQKALAQFTGVSPERLKAAENELKLLEKKKLAVTGKETLDALKKETELLGIRLTQGEKEYEVQKALYQLKGGDPAMLQAIEAQVRAQQLLNEQIAITEEITSGAFKEYLDGITAIQTAADGAGQVIVEAFGRVAQQLNEMTKGQLEYAKQLDQLEKKKAAVDRLKDSAIKTKALTDIEREKGRLEKENYQSQIGHMAGITGAAKSMFSEQSKGRQALHRMEMTFSAIELAMSIQRTAANALEAITSAFAAPFPINFASGAAMIAIMAGLGVFTGSSSGGPSAQDRQESQGTGTVLGDSSAKSESIANSLERIESLELDQYSELRSINASIRALNAGIAKLAVNLVASYGKFDESSYQGDLGKDYNVQLGSTAGALVLGGVIGAAVDNMLGGLLSGITNKVLGGLFGSTKKELVDSGISFAAQELGDILSSGLVKATLYDTIKVTKKKAFGLSKKTYEETSYKTLDEDIRAEFGRVFSYIGNSVTDAVKLLGLTTTKDLENFVIKLPNISFKDLTGEEIEEELQAIFSQQGDLMAKYLVPGIAEFQQMGEGLYDTLIRVAQEQAVFNASMDSLGLQLTRFSGMTKTLEIDVAQSLIELMGGIEEFSSATSDYFSAFFTEQEKMAHLTKQAQAQFASLGIAMPANREAFKAFVASLDLTTEAGQQTFAAMMKLNQAMDQYYDQAEQHAAELANWTKSIGDELASLDMSPFQRSMAELQSWYDAQIAEAAELGADTTLLERLYARKRADLIAEELEAINEDTAQRMQTLTSEHERAVNDLQSTYKALTDSISAVSSTIGSSILDIKRQIAGWDEVGYQQQQVDGLSGQLGKGDLATQIKTIEQLQAAMMGRYQAELAQNSTLVQQAQSTLDGLNSSFAELQSALSSVQESIASSILDLRRQGSSWNEVGYQNSRIGDLRSQLGKGSVLDQINSVGQLQQAIVDRYNAELAANQQLISAAQERYDADLSAYNALKDAAKQLSSAADALLLSELSPAKMGDQFAEAQKQFNDLLRKARGGDADAAKQLESVGSTYLGLAQDYLASGSSEYAAIFAQVQNAYRSFGNSIGAAPSVPREVLAYQKADAELQTAAIKELEQLQLLLSGLDATAKAELLAAEAAAKAELAKYQEQLLALQTGTVTELQLLQIKLAELDAQARAEQAAQLDKLTATFETAKSELLAAAEKQIAAVNALNSGMQSIANAIAAMPAPVVVVNPPPPVVIPPVVVNPAPVSPGTGVGTAPINVGEPVTNPILERTNDLLQQQLQQASAAQAQSAQQNRQLQTELQRTQQLLQESRRLMA